MSIILTVVTPLIPFTQNPALAMLVEQILICVVVASLGAVLMMKFRRKKK